MQPNLLINWPLFDTLDKSVTKLNQLLETCTLQSVSIAISYPSLLDTPSHIQFKGIHYGINEMARVTIGSFTEKLAVDVLKKAGAEFVIIQLDDVEKDSKIQALLLSDLSIYIHMNQASLDVEKLFEGLSEDQRERITLIYPAPQEHLSLAEWEKWIKTFDFKFKALLAVPHYSTVIPPLLEEHMIGYYFPKGPLSIGLLSELFNKLSAKKHV